MTTVDGLRARQAQLVAIVRDRKITIRTVRRELVEAAAELERVNYRLQQLTTSPGAGDIHGQTDPQSR